MVVYYYNYKPKAYILYSMYRCIYIYIYIYIYEYTACIFCVIFLKYKQTYFVNPFSVYS